MKYKELLAGHGQNLIEHLLGVESLSGEGLGILHDIAKVSNLFQQKLKGEVNQFRHPIAALPIADFVFRKLNDRYRLEKLFSIYFHHSSFNLSTLQNDLIKLSNNENLGNVLLSKEEAKIAFDILNDDEIKKIFKMSFNFEEFVNEVGENFKEGYKIKLLEILKEFYIYTDNIDSDKKNKIANFYYKLVNADWKNSSHYKEDSVKWDDLISSFDNEFNKLRNISSNLNKVRNSIQNLVWNLKEDRVLLSAPTGSGKTEASLRWALKKAKESNAERIIYVLPFKVLIDDLSMRFKKYFGDEHVDVWHSSYLSKELLNLTFDSFDSFNFYNTLRRYFLNKRIIITTADQILMSYLNVSRYAVRRGLFQNSVFVFDEIQGYPDLFRGVLYKFISSLKKPFMIMTATPPLELGDWIKFDKEIINKEWTNKLHTYTNAKFYGFNLLKQHKDLLTLVLDKSNSFKKIAIVTNTVKKAIDIYSELKGKIEDKKILLLHGNLIKDDKDKISKIIFEEDNYILISTQVIEAGIDISFDFMFREVAPFSSIVQSIGRVNRKGRLNNAGFMVFAFKDKEDVEYLPYNKEEVSLVTSFFKEKKSLDSKLELENVLFDKIGESSKERLEMNKYFIDYSISYFDKLIWSIKDVEDVLGSSLRDGIDLKKEVFVVINEDDYHLNDKAKEIKEKLKKNFNKKLLEEYIDILLKRQNQVISVYPNKYKEEFITYDEYEEISKGKKEEKK